MIIGGLRGRPLTDRLSSVVPVSRNDSRTGRPLHAAGFMLSVPFHGLVYVKREKVDHGSTGGSGALPAMEPSYEPFQRPWPFEA